MLRLHFESRLQASAETVWPVISRMAGVNHELMPLMRMSVPRALREFDIGQAPTGRPAFSSWLLAFGFLPVDRHHLCIETVWPGRGFDERSHSWMNRLWVHRRRIEPLAQGVRLSDELEFQPRLALAEPLVAAVVRQLFAHRHRRLRARFGVAA